MQKEIGSDYWISKDEIIKSKTYPEIHRRFRYYDYRYLSTGRSALRIILGKIDCNTNKRVLVPAFTCHVIIEPFTEAGYTVFPYPVTRNLTVNQTQMEQLVEEVKPNIIMLHSYFGFNTLADIHKCINQWQSEGISVIEDVTQNLFSEFPITKCRYIIASIRKWLPIPDGAMILDTLQQVICDPLQVDTELINEKINAMLLKSDYIYHNEGNKENFRKRFAFAEQILDSRKIPYVMSEESRGIYASTNIEEIEMKRKRNFEVLVRETAICWSIERVFTSLPINVVPFQFPVYVKAQRSKFQKYLAERDIYATVIWACPEGIRDKIDHIATQIYDEILCFPCDQRYDEDDMHRISSVIISYEKDNLRESNIE